jgi:hypothetical protein
MYSVRVCSTNDRDLPPPELGPGLTWDRLTEVLARGVSAEAAGLLAEPIHDEMRGQTHWHITSQDDPKPISALSPAEQEALLARLDERRQEILQYAARIEAEGGDPNLRLAAALRAILAVPEEKAHVWLADGKPVLTAWARVPDALIDPSMDRFVKSRSASGGQGGLAGATIVGTSNRPIEDPSAPGASGPAGSAAGFGAASVAAGAAPAAAIPAVEERGALWPTALLWALFTVLVALAYYALLPACGLHLPFLSRLSDHCLYADQSGLAALRIKNASLRDAIAAAELEVAENRGACAAQKDSLLTDQPNTPPSVKEAEERVQQANLSSDSKFDITLVWNGREDLDLHVFCADGHIFYGSRTGCGGTLDIDRNSKRSDAIENPVEHISWQDDPPPGDYRVEVILFDRFEMAPRNIPFNVIIRDSSGQREYKGQIQQQRTPIQVVNFHR